ncbi:MAG: hypothetical protein RIB86_14355 [Imperialibacter sp.]
MRDNKAGDRLFNFSVNPVKELNGLVVALGRVNDNHAVFAHKDDGIGTDLTTLVGTV